MSTRKKIFLKQDEEKEILQGFPWVFDNEILSIKNNDENHPIQDGSEVDVFSKSGNFLGTGIYNSKSKISVRILSRKKDVEFNKQNVKDVLGISIPTTGSRLIGNIGYFFEPIIMTFFLHLSFFIDKTFDMQKYIFLLIFITFA